MTNSNRSSRIDDHQGFRMPGQCAGSGRVSRLLAGLLIVIVIIVLLLSQEDSGVGMAL